MRVALRRYHLLQLLSAILPLGKWQEGGNTPSDRHSPTGRVAGRSATIEYDPCLSFLHVLSSGSVASFLYCATWTWRPPALVETSSSRPPPLAFGPLLHILA